MTAAEKKDRENGWFTVPITLPTGAVIYAWVNHNSQALPRKAKK